MATSTVSMEQLAINTIRTLSMDAVQAANSGHPGTPMALAPLTYSIWSRVLKYDPEQPLWPNRDRFILSCGHASMLLYSMLHLAGVKNVDHHGKLTGGPAVSLEEIKNFRQLDSKTPGHPEFKFTTGVETTTGPLGQGVTNSVGMAAASQWLGSYFNKPGFELFNFDVYAVCSDGDLMEGIASEAASIAGHLKLPNLCWIYDNNNITIEGDTDLAFSEDVAMRFESYGWNTIHIKDANDVEAITTALQTFKDTKDRPTLIVLDSHIAWGAPNKQDTHGAHGAPLGDEEIRLTKHAYGWPEDAKFLVPDGVLGHFQESLGKRGSELSQAWQTSFEKYKQEYPELARTWMQMEKGELPENWDEDIPTFEASEKGVASRGSSGKVLQSVAKNVPWLVGGSADLAPSTKTLLEFEGAGAFQPNSYGGRNFHFGIREHAMAGICNGMATCHLRPYGATFLVFSDYCRPSLRLASIMELPCIFIFTHDSIGVGEDGPTHQPIEHVSSLRAMPLMQLIRPGDANEVAEAWRTLMKIDDAPCSMILTRQNIPTLDREKYASAEGVAKGAYILADCDGTPEVILMGTGSELSLCVDAYEQLTADGVKARVVSMPCWEWFEKQPAAYQEEVFPSEVAARVAVEMGTDFGWYRYVGSKGKTVTLSHFGASAPIEELTKKFGFTPENVAKVAKEAIAEQTS
ncbi:Transketolase [Planctomycetales bacterium 10988]|nr:Transketolase [Planctomycetales bacterium 10988]